MINSGLIILGALGVYLMFKGVKILTGWSTLSEGSLRYNAVLGLLVFVTGTGKLLFGINGILGG